MIQNRCPTKLAMIALIMSPGINANDNLIDSFTGIFVMNPIIIVPKISKPRTPTTKVAINKIIKLILCKYLSLTHPIKKATNGYKNKNPADGPANAPIPPRPPDKTGNPTAASNKKITTLNVPNFLPKMIPC